MRRSLSVLFVLSHHVVLRELRNVSWYAHGEGLQFAYATAYNQEAI